MRKTEQTILIIMIILCGLGVLSIYSSTRDSAGYGYAIRQVIWIALGFALMLLVRKIHIRTLMAFALPFYGITVVLLGLVLVVGTGPFATKRWFDLGFMRFQPSEVAKIGLVMMLARYLSDIRGFSLGTILKVFAMALIPAVLVLFEPDLGTAVVLGIIAFPMLFAAGLDWIHVIFLASPFIALACSSRLAAWIVFAGLLVILLIFGRFRVWLVSLVLAINVGVYAIAPFAWENLAQYQRDRLIAFVRPDKDVLGAGFQTTQSMIAIGSGGIAGKGLFKGTQKALGLIPEQHTDFIFSVIGEEMGFVGSLGVILLLGFLLTKFLRLASELRDKFSIFFCFGFTTLLIVQMFINIGMTLRIMPVTGLPLPLLSYGGSHMLMLWLACGIIFAAYRTRLEY